MGRGDAGFGRVADQVVEVVAPEPLGLHDVDRMEEERQAEVLHHLIDRMEHLVAELVVQYMGRRVDAPDAGKLGRARELLDGEVRRVPGQHRKAHHPVGDTWHGPRRSRR